MTATLDIALLAYDDANAVDVFGPLQVFASANELLANQPATLSHPFGSVERHA